MSEAGEKKCRLLIMTLILWLYSAKLERAFIYLDMEPAGFYCQLEETRLNWEERPSFEESPGSE